MPQETTTSPATRGPLDLKHSQHLLDRARAFDAQAAGMERVIASDRMVDGEYPTYVARAKGAYLWDVDGNQYIDYLLGYGTIILGHAHDAVVKAARTEMESGFATGMMKTAQVRLTAELTEITPNAEKALLLKTGSDATGAAVRIARSFTGRDRVVRWGYNGWHDWCALRPAGIPGAVRDLVHSFRYNDLDSLRAIFEAHPNEIACLVMMPFETEAPEPGFLEGIREITRRHGTLLVWDEMRTGFRLSLGGAQEYFGIDADLVTFSKAMANGFEVSAVVGCGDVLDQLANVHISSTFFSNSAAMAAASATIGVLRSSSALDHVRDLGLRLQEGLRDLVRRNGLPARVVGYPQMPFLCFDHADPDAREAAKRTFFGTTVREGVFFHPNHHWYICASMTEADIDATLAASSAGFAAVSRAGLAR